MKFHHPFALTLALLIASAPLGRAAPEICAPTASPSEPTIPDTQRLRQQGLVVTRAGTGEPADVSLPSAPSSRAAATISQRDQVFTPGEVTIKAHRFIIIQNDDTVSHHAYCHSANMKYTSGAMAPGSQVSIMFDQPGTYEVRCAIHPKMLLTVKVEEPM